MSIPIAKRTVGSPPHAIDIHVGRMIRAERIVRGMSQTELGDKLGVAFQQVQKYEKGTNRVSASMLYTIALVFDVEVAIFFPRRDGTIRNGDGETARLMAVPGAPKLMKTFARLDPHLQIATVASMTTFVDTLTDANNDKSNARKRG